MRNKAAKVPRFTLLASEETNYLNELMDERGEPQKTGRTDPTLSAGDKPSRVRFFVSDRAKPFDFCDSICCAKRCGGWRSTS
jgi:hypothetical protein